MHCKSGADRAGLASGLALLFEGGTSQDALASCPGGSAIGAGRAPASWTPSSSAIAAEAEGRVPFLHWVEHEYDEAALRRDFVAGGLARFLVDRVLVRE